MRNQLLQESARPSLTAAVRKSERHPEALPPPRDENRPESLDLRACPGKSLMRRDGFDLTQPQVFEPLQCLRRPRATDILIGQRVETLYKPISQQSTGIARKRECRFGNLLNGCIHAGSLLPAMAPNNIRRPTRLQENTKRSNWRPHGGREGIIFLEKSARFAKHAVLVRWYRATNGRNRGRTNFFWIFNGLVERQLHSPTEPPDDYGPQRTSILIAAAMRRAFSRAASIDSARASATPRRRLPAISGLPNRRRSVSGSANAAATPW